MTRPNNPVKIYLDSGRVITMRGEQLKVKTTALNNDLERIDWEGISTGESPLFLSLKNVAAVTEVLEAGEGE